MKYLLFAMLFISSVTLKSQSINFNSDETIEIRSVKPIEVNNEITGYFVFTKIDKLSKKESLFNFIVLDKNLKQTNKLELTRANDARLVKNHFNGTSFYLEIFQPTAKLLEIFYINNSLEIIKKEEAIEFSTPYYNEIKSILTVKDKGFIELYPKNNPAALCEFKDNSGNSVWSSFQIPREKKKYESILGCSGSTYLYNYIVYSKGYKSLDTNLSYLELRSIDNNKPIKKIGYNLIKKNINLSASEVDFDYNRKVYILKGKNPWVRTKVEFNYYQIEIDENGKILYECYFNELDLKTIKYPNNYQPNPNFKLYYHDLITTSDEKHFLICEEYNSKKISNEIGNFQLISLDSNFKPTKIEIFEKKHADIIEINSNKQLSFYEAYTKPEGLDYQFYTFSPDRKSFSITYVNIEDKKENIQNIGNITLTKEGEFSHDKIKLTTKPTKLIVLPAKIGYVTIFEYFEKEKRIDFRLEKLNL